MPTLAFDIREQFSLGTKDGDITAIKDTPYQTGTLFDVLSVVLKNIYLVAGIILFIFIIVGGVGMILNAGNTEKLKQSNKTLTSAVIGFLILFASFWIIRIIEIITGVQIITGIS